MDGPCGVLTRNTRRRRFVQTFERRLSQETTHPVFGYRVSMRRMLILQAHLLSRFLGQIGGEPPWGI